MNGEFGREPLAQEAAAAALGVAVRAGQPLGGIELGEGGAGQLGEGLLSGGGEIGKAARALRDSEICAGDRVEFDECLDVGVGDLAGQRAAGSV